MKTILAPTRGGQRSYANQDRAAQIAKEQGARLIYLYISDVTFLNQVASPVLIDMEAEMEEMGEFLLTMAQDRAAKYGVAAETVVRQGVFTDVMESVIDEFDIDMVVMGSSGEDDGHTTPGFMAETAQALADKYDVDVTLLREGKVLETVHS
jgi:nucleotide-binding universal stress UspA family protein